eukprot:Pgem_evm1s16531
MSSTIISSYVVPSIISLRPVYKAKIAKNYNSIDIFPYIALLGNFATYIIYAVIHDNDPFVFFSSLIGLCTTTWLLINLYSLTTNETKRITSEIYIILSIASIVGSCFAYGYIDSQTTRKLLAGIMANVFARNSKYLYWPFILASLLTNVLWVIYGMISLGDVLFWWPNLLGAVLNGLQLLLIIIFRPKLEDEEQKDSNEDDIDVNEKSMINTVSSHHRQYDSFANPVALANNDVDDDSNSSSIDEELESGISNSDTDDDDGEKLKDSEKDIQKNNFSQV